MFINADDFGYSASVNAAIAMCFAEKRINRTTIMVNMPFAEEARQLAFDRGFDRAVGLHINLTEGKALSPECAASPLCNENGEFLGTFHIPIKSRLYLNKKIRYAIRKEAEAQVKKFLEMGFTLLHADSHNYCHSYISVWNEVKKVLKDYGFESVRISRNIPKGSFSLGFGVYKNFINCRLKHFKTKHGRIKTTKYFGSVQDYNATKNKSEISDSLELMTHPDMIDGKLIDNTLPNAHPFVTSEWIAKNGLVMEDLTDKRIKLLVTFIPAHIGGAMTSLVNFLNCLDTTKYNVDVLFYEIEGRWGIKKEINILPQAKNFESYSISNILRKLVSPSYVVARIRDFYYKKVKNNKRRAVQIMSKQGSRYSPRLEKEYDIAVAYEYTWALNYLATKVNAKKKIAWHHLDYETSGLVFKEDKKAFENVDALVFVSRNCLEKFVADHPEFSEKAHFIANILTSDYVRQKGEETVELPFKDDENLIKLLTVARISFEHKGLDRGVEAFARLRDEGLLNNVRWTIIGKGRDSENLKKMIEDNNLQEYIFPIGVRENPIPYMKKSDALLLPSRHEGKPMVVTEAFIMGLVPIVTRYTSAHEQIKNGVDGLVFENNTEALYEGLRKLLMDTSQLLSLKEKIISTDYGNPEEIKRFDFLVDQLLTEDCK